MQSRMILCGGTQSGGTTIISWCFLQRRDTDGVLDMHAAERFRTSFERVTTPILWVKMTIHAFRLLDLHDVYRDLGWEVTPLFVARDVRSSFLSLMKKPYGYNGTTADEPPLRLRFRRFLQDWETATERGWPIVKYEDVVCMGRPALIQTCEQLAIQWDEGMVRWTKRLEDIAYVEETNDTFTDSLKAGGFERVVRREKAAIAYERLPIDELDWLEETFLDYNRSLGYPLAVDRSKLAPDPLVLTRPTFDGSVREWWETEYYRLWAQVDQLTEENEKLRRQLDAYKRGSRAGK